VSKLAKANLVFKSESRCKSIISSCKSTAGSEGFTVNGEQKTWKSVLSWPKIWNRCLNPCNNSAILSFYWFKSLFSPVARTLFRQGNELCHHRKVVSPQGQLQLDCTHGVIILCDKSFAALQPFVQIIFKSCVISTIKARTCIHSEDWNPKTGLPFFFIKFSISSRK